jgi:hypothetical protein
MKSNAAKSLVALAVVVFAWPAYRVQQLLRLEGVGGTAAHVFFRGGDTRFASRFSDGSFLNVTPGMSTAQVLALLGEPLERYRPGAGVHQSLWDEGMRWSRSADDSHYSVRAVTFLDGTVVERHSEFYVD